MITPSNQELLQPVFHPYSFVVFIVVSRLSEKKGISSDGYGSDPVIVLVVHV